MPNRIIKESICTSDSIDKLTWFEEAMFYRLIVNCDDYGRFDGRAAVIKSRLFPLKDNITVKAVEAAIKKLVSVELVTLYVFEGKPYLHLPTWDSHQQIRAKRSKYPSPDEADKVICNHMISDDIRCARNPIQSESNPNTESESECAGAERDRVFNEFWSAYPKKVGKKDAQRAFAKVPKAEWPKLIPAVERQKKSKQWQKDDGQYIPNPSTWLNQGRWDDEVNEVDNSRPAHIKGQVDSSTLKRKLETI